MNLCNFQLFSIPIVYKYDCVYLRHCFYFFFIKASPEPKAHGDFFLNDGCSVESCDVMSDVDLHIRLLSSITVYDILIYSFQPSIC